MPEQFMYLAKKDGILTGDFINKRHNVAYA